MPGFSRLPPPAAVLAGLLLGLLVAGGWWLANRPLPGGPAIAGGKLASVSFAPYRAGQSPFTGRFPSGPEVDQDLAMLAHHVRAVRTYAAIEGNYVVARLAKRHGLKLWQGIWLGPDRAQNAREMAAAIQAARDFPDTVDRVVVGNEVLLRRDLPVKELIADIDHVKAAVKQPVTYADVWEFWEKYPQVAAHVDIVTIHLLPYWEDSPTGIGRAVAHVLATYRHMQALFPGKPIAVGETGWPSAGRWRADAAPSVVNQARFIREFVAAARKQGIDYNLIEAFDQDWKYRSEGTVGANWGIWTDDRRQKWPFAGAVVEDPGWPLWAGLAVLAGWVLLGAGLSGTGVAAGALRPAGQLRLALIAMGLGAGLGYAAAATVPIAYDASLTVALIGNLAGQAALALLLVRRAARLLAGHQPPPSRSGAVATDAVRALFRGRLPPRAAWFDDLSFVFLWTAVVLELLLLFDPRYRDFPLGPFAVPVLAVLARAWLGDLKLAGGGREEAVLGLTLVAATLGSAWQEGLANRQSLAWAACALLLAAPPLLSFWRREMGGEEAEPAPLPVAETAGEG